MPLESKTVWLIMDTQLGIVGRGVPRNRQLQLVGGKSQARLLTYTSIAKAILGYTKDGFYLGEGVAAYFIATYNLQVRPGWLTMQDIQPFLQAVSAVITVTLEGNPK